MGRNLSRPGCTVAGWRVGQQKGFNRSEPAHEAVVSTLKSPSDQLVVSPYVIAELDYLIATRVGVAAETAVLEELAGGAYILPSFSEKDLAAAIGVVAEYSDLGIGIADASIVVLAQRYATATILTLDRRHFGALRPATGGAFTLLPD